MKPLRIALWLQLLFFGAWGAWLLAGRNTASPEFYLETEPVDPRDLLSGTYVALSYGISDPRSPGCTELMRNALSMHVELKASGRLVATPLGPLRVHEAADCSAKPRPGWARARVEPAFGGRTMARYGIERFYLNENNPLKDARSGEVLAKVKLGGDGGLILLDLVATK